MEDTMNSARPAQSGEGGATGQGVLSGNREVFRREGSPENAAVVPQLRPKRAGYGLPCAKCRAYYAADQSKCPICSATERVSPNTVSLVTGVSEPAPNDCRDDAALEVERERFLREFKSQLFFAQDAMRESEPQHVWHPAGKAERLLEEDAGPSNRVES